MAAISRPLLWRRTLIMRSVPILPDPIMPTLILPACVISVPLSMCEPLHATQRERTQMLVAHSNIVALADSHRFGDATGKYQGTCGDFLTACAQHIGQHGHALSRMPQHCRPRCRSNHLAVLFHENAQVLQVDADGAASIAANQVSGRRRVVRHDTFEIEFEI